MSSSMRDLIQIVENKNSIEMDEGILDFLKKVAPVLDPVARARKHGQREVSDLTKLALNKFAQYMGRLKKDFSDVTWNSLFKYLTIKNQLGISPEDAKQIIISNDTKTGVKKILDASKLTMPPPTTWGNSASTISGDPANPKSMQTGQAIVTYILELAAIKHLEDAAGGISQNTTSAAGTPGTATPTTPTAAPATPAAQPAPAASASAYNPAVAPQKPVPTGNQQADNAANILYQLQLAMHALAGANP